MAGLPPGMMVTNKIARVFPEARMTAPRLTSHTTPPPPALYFQRQGERFNALLSQRIGAVEGVLNTKISNSVFAEKTKETMLTLSEVRVVVGVLGRHPPCCCCGRFFYAFL